MHVPTLSFDLGEEIDMLRWSVAQFAAAHIAPLAADADAGNQFPNTLWRQLGEQGLLAVSVDDQRLTWPERELVEQLGTRLYGPRPAEDLRHG